MKTIGERGRKQVRMTPEERMHDWPEQSQDVAQAMREWRTSQLTVTMDESKRAVEEQISRVRTSVIEAMVTDEPKEWTEKPAAVACPQREEQMQRRGKHQRSVQSQGGQRVTITRQSHSCPACGSSLFPLDEEVNLPARGRMPQVHHTLVRWAARLPFEEASEALHLALGVQISDATARRVSQPRSDPHGAR